MNEKLKGVLGELFNGIDKVIDTKTVVGDAQIFGDTVIVPLIEVNFALGAGGFEKNTDNKNKGALAAKVKPTAVLVIKDGNTRIINVGSGSTIDKIIDLTPEIVDKFKKGIKGSKEEKEDIINKAFNSETI